MASIAIRRDRLEELLADKGVHTNVAAADLLGMNNATVSRVRSGRANPGDSFIANALVNLPTTFDDLFEIIDDTVSPALAAAAA